MKFIIAVDCEGVACAAGTPHKTLNESPNYAFACAQATREADAAARALFDSGAERVIVWDAHSGGANLDYLQLDRRCEIAHGADMGCRWPGLDETFDGVLLVGYHAMDGTADAVMAHTMSSVLYQSIQFNGQCVGEIAIDAASAGEFGVPVIFVSSDDKGVAEARALLSGVACVVTKQSLGWNAAISKHPLHVVDEIYEAVKAAAKNTAQFTVFHSPSPLTIEKRFKRIESAQQAANDRSGGWQRVDAYTVRKTVDSIRNIY